MKFEIVDGGPIERARFWGSNGYYYASTNGVESGPFGSMSAATAWALKEAWAEVERLTDLYNETLGDHGAMRAERDEARAQNDQLGSDYADCARERDQARAQAQVFAEDFNRSWSVLVAIVAAALEGGRFRPAVSDTWHYRVPDMLVEQAKLVIAGSPQITPTDG